MIKKRINVFNKHKSKYYGKEIFDNLNSIRKYFIDMIKDEIIPKIENDIDFIIKKGWADNVSSSDLYHCHILINHRINHNEDELKKASNYRILYHSRELQKETKDRNIISSFPPFISPLAISLFTPCHSLREKRQIALPSLNIALTDLSANGRGALKSCFRSHGS